MRRPFLVSLATAALFGCQSDRPLVPRSGRPSAMISDQAHSGGTQGFFFLPPLVAQPTATGVFNRRLAPAPVVVVDRLALNGCTALQVRLFSGADVTVSNDHFLTSWHTDQDNLLPACTYRIRVTVGSRELGFADVDVVGSGKELKSVETDQFIPLLDDRTLPINFRIEIGALTGQTCPAGADCGEGIASPDQNTTIVTENQRAGTFIPAGAVDAEVGVIVRSVDDRPCIPGLVGATFEGMPTANGNSCYEFRTDPPVSTVNKRGRFNTNVTVGICVALSGVSTTEEPKIQIFQFDDGEPPRIRPLPNVPAPFLPCDPSFGQTIGAAKHGLLDLAARAVGRLLSPRPLFASAHPMVFDFGAGGSTDGFSLFTWGLVTNMAINDGNGQTATVGSAVATPPSVIFTDSTGAPVDSVPVTFTTGGGASVSGAITKSGRVGIAGVAQVGSWTLGPTLGSYTLTASAPSGSGVINTPQTFTATASAEPILAYRHSEQFSVDGVELDRYRLTVTNRSAFPASMFAAAPDLPPCGLNPNSSQSWVDIYNGSTNDRIYGFCALSSPDELNDIWFAVPRWTQPPTSVYITITDRRANVVYTSNTISLFGPLFVNFPREVELNWSAVAGAASYEIEMQYCESWASPDWRTCNLDWKPWTHLMSYTGGASYIDTFVGDQPGRWRVRANDATGNPISSFTEYQYFTYITGPGAP
jgi:hypothetical protein